MGGPWAGRPLGARPALPTGCSVLRVSRPGGWRACACQGEEAPWGEADPQLQPRGVLTPLRAGLSGQFRTWGASLF